MTSDQTFAEARLGLVDDLLEVNSKRTDRMQK